MITITTDGSAPSNSSQSVGGWAYHLYDPETDNELYDSGHIIRATNNQAELIALIQALRSCPIGSTVEFHTDSRYLITGLENMDRWTTNEWRGRDNKPIKNQPLWKELRNVLLTRSLNIQATNLHERNTSVVSRVLDAKAKSAAKGEF